MLYIDSGKIIQEDQNINIEFSFTKLLVVCLNLNVNKILLYMNQPAYPRCDTQDK